MRGAKTREESKVAALLPTQVILRKKKRIFSDCGPNRNILVYKSKLIHFCPWESKTDDEASKKEKLNEGINHCIISPRCSNIKIMDGTRARGSGCGCDSETLPQYKQLYIFISLESSLLLKKA